MAYGKTEKDKLKLTSVINKEEYITSSISEAGYYIIKRVSFFGFDTSDPDRIQLRFDAKKANKSYINFENGGQVEAKKYWEVCQSLKNKILQFRDLARTNAES